MKPKPFLIVVSAPSGAGKTSLCREVAKRLPRLHYGISATTRPKRPGERQGRDYHFLSPAAFEKGIRKGEFVESAKVYGHFYGTPRGELDSWLERGYDVLLDVDVQGGRSLRRLYPEASFVFVVAPSLAAYRERLHRRGLDSKEAIARRMQNVRRELSAGQRYDYRIVNSNLAQAVSELEAIIRVERLKVFRSWDRKRGTRRPRPDISKGGRSNP